ncbi:MAG TPA: GNAT family N-acetyltransferase [Deltaproteobacteria bacterium]|jgi:ribosomal protein S18 acetylase RimI-like enzyme|nr:GNAT family N-acetyltransferase [Deltaproteobacteria bacterium]HQI02165.1 GNAT family N-acetyltransferase [Deltaproteobacteria bacterium]
MVKPQLSILVDFHQWIRLAGEVEPLFGPMVEDPGFHEGLRRSISEGNAFCVRVSDGESGSTLQGGIIISREENEILWFAVAQGCRGQGIGKALLEEAIGHLDQSRPMTVITFDKSVEAGIPARRLYRMYGFDDHRPGDLNPAGVPTVIMARLNERG